MFEFLKRHLSRSVKKLTKKVSEKKLSEKDIDKFFSEVETDLLQSNIALEVIDFLKKSLKEKLVNKQIKREEAKEFVEKTFKESILEILKQKPIDLKEIIEKAKLENRPAVLVFLGFNGTGKSLSLSKVAKYLKDRGLKVLLAAGDTYRACGIHQLEGYAKKVGVEVIKQKYGADSCAVIYDGVLAARARGYDALLADTSGRSHANVSLIEELEKICRVNKPDLKILVLDVLSGNDIIPQAKKFDEAVGIDVIILTKADVYDRGGAVISATYTIKKPILFLGVGQDMDDLEKFDSKKIVNNLFA